MLGGRGRDTPADLAGMTDAGKRDAGEAKKGEVREDDREIEQEGRRTEIDDEDGGTKRDEDAEINEERRLAGRRKIGEDEIFGEDEKLKFGEDETRGEDEKRKVGEDGKRVDKDCRRRLAGMVNVGEGASDWRKGGENEIDWAGGKERGQTDAERP